MRLQLLKLLSLCYLKYLRKESEKMKNNEIKTLIEQGIYFIKVIVDTLLPDDKEDNKDDKE